MEAGVTVDEKEISREAEFFDQAYSTGSRRAVGRIYAITKNRLESYERLIYLDVKGKRVLEYGCGTGSHSIAIARRGGIVTGIDISPVGVEKARQRAKSEGLDNATYEIMDAEKMTFTADSFDLVIGEGILHHLSLEHSYAEIARVLRPAGRAVFMEPLGHNLMINLFRRFTPTMRTPDEHPLMRRDLKQAEQYFMQTSFEYHHLSSFAALAFLGRRQFDPVVRGLDRIDRALFRLLPPLGLLSWYVIMVLSDPRGKSSSQSA